MKRYLFALLIAMLGTCMISSSQDITGTGWKNPLLHENRHINYNNTAYQNTQYNSGSFVSFSKGTFSLTERSLQNAQPFGGGGGFGGSSSGSSISYSNGSYSNAGSSYSASPISFPSYSPVSPMSNKDEGSIYLGDAPGTITGFENATLDNAIVTAGGGWYKDECPVCHHQIWRQKNHGAQDDMYDEPNGSKKHVCQGHPDLPIGDINIIMVLSFLAIYMLYKIRYEKSIINSNNDDITHIM